MRTLITWQRILSKIFVKFEKNLKFLGNIEKNVDIDTKGLSVKIF